MSNINWKIRIGNKTFWLTVVPAILLLIQAVAALFGFTLDLSEFGEKLKDVINAVFLVLAIIGIVADPTTVGVSDSTQALTYEIAKTKDGVTTKSTTSTSDTNS